MTNIAIIGISGYGGAHLRHIAREVDAGRARLVAATVINQEEEQEKCAELVADGCQLFEDYREMLENLSSRIDLVMIPTGIPSHEELTVAALESGAFVYVEKPLAPTVQAVHRIREAERRTGRWAAVGFQDVYQPGMRAFKSRLIAGEFGAVKRITGYTCWPRHDKYYARNSWAGRLKTGGSWVLDSPLNNAMAHHPNLMFFLAGPTLDQTSRLEHVQAELYRARQIESFDTFCLRARSVAGVEFLMAGTHACAGVEGPVIRVETESAVFQKKNSLPFHREGDTSPVVEEPVVSPLACVLDRIEGKPAPFCDTAVAETHTVCVNAAHDSSAIHGVPSGQISSLGEGGQRVDAIAGIETLLKTAASEARLFSELDCPWAKPGRSVDVREYHEFRGGVELEPAVG